MHPTEPKATQMSDELAQKYGVSSDAVKTLSQAIIAGNGAALAAGGFGKLLLCAAWRKHRRAISAL